MAEQEEQSQAAPKSFRELTQGPAASEGVWRLSVVLGFLGLAAWLVFWLYGIGTQIGFVEFVAWILGSPSHQLGHPNMFLLVIILSGAVAFIAPWGVVQIIGWVIEGFIRDST